MLLYNDKVLFSDMVFICKLKRPRLNWEPLTSSPDYSK